MAQEALIFAPNAKNSPMLIFLYGGDNYRLLKKAKEIEEQYKKIHKAVLNLEKIDASQIEFRQFSDLFNQRSMFVEKKLFFLDNVFSNPKFKEEFLKKINDISQSQNVVVVLEKKEIPQKDKILLALKKQAKCQNFEILTGVKLKNWLKREFAKYGAATEEKVLNKLIEFVGSDLWQLSNEIIKLSTYTKNIQEKDVELLVKPVVEAGIFETIGALASRNKKSALRLLKRHLDKGDNPFYILTMITWQFRNLLLVKSVEGYGAKIPQGMNPFVFRKTAELARYFSLPELKKIYRKIFEADINIKTGKIAPEEGLRMLIAEI